MDVHVWWGREDGGGGVLKGICTISEDSCITLTETVLNWKGEPGQAELQICLSMMLRYC